MIARLRAKPGGERIPVTVGNFADVAVAGRFSLIYVVFSTFFALLTQDEQVRCFENVARHEIFKIISLVDVNCQEIEAFSNLSGGDKRVLSSGDGLQVRFGDREYVLQLIYDPGGAGQIYLGYFQSSQRGG